MQFHYKNKLGGFNWFKPSLGIGINEGGRGPIFVWNWKNHSIYLCFWTKWIAPRISFLPLKVSFNP